MFTRFLYVVLGGLLILLAQTLNGEFEDNRDVKEAKEIRQELINTEVVKQFEMIKRGIINE